MALARMAHGGRARVRMADGGSLLGNALDAITAPDPSGSNPIQTRTVTPFPGDYNTYGEGPEWNWFSYLNGQGNGQPPVTPPVGMPPPPGSPGAGDTGGGMSQNGGDSNGHQGKGPTGEGPGQAAADAAARNVSANPSMKSAISMGQAMMGPLGMMGLLGKTALSQFGIGNNPFTGPQLGPALSAAQQAAIANSTANLNPNAPTVTIMNAIDNAIALARQQAMSGQGGISQGSFLGAGDPTGMAARAVAAAAGRGSSVGDGGNFGGGFAGAGDPGGMGERAAANAAGRGSSVGNGGGGPGNSGGGTGGGGLSGGGSRGFSTGGKARVKGLGWLANGGRLHMAGGGSTNNPIITSLIPILAGLVGNIASGPIGGALASGAATAMTGGTMLDAMQNVGSTSGDAIDQLLKYFPALTSGGAQTDTTAKSGVDPVAAQAMAALAKLTNRVPAANDATIPGTASGTAALYTGRSAMPGSYAHGGELDARGGTHIQGEGDGQSDDIPAKLSDGEFVVDAATVSSLGNGSNKEGAARLEQLRHMVRKKAGYKNVKTIPPKMNAAKMLGAIAHGRAA